MPESIKKGMILPVVIMTAVCIVMTLLLASANALTRDRIAVLAVQANEASRRSILPEAVEFLDLKIPDGHTSISAVMEGKNASGKSAGFILTSAYRGYGGLITIMTGIGADGIIHDIQVIKDDETPGLGKKVRDDAFLAPFIGKDATLVFTVKPDDNTRTHIDAVSGATISSRGVTEAVNKACAAYLAIKGGTN
jgi:electron transport complex protein RnfG